MLAIIMMLQTEPKTAEVPTPVVSISSSSSPRTFPNEMFEPYSKYSGCMTEKTNAAMSAAGGVSRGDQVRVIYAQARLDCRDIRVAAANDGDLILKRKGISGKKRRAAIVENALSIVDEHGDDFAAMVDRSNSPEEIAARKKASDAQNQ